MRQIRHVNREPSTSTGDSRFRLRESRWSYASPEGLRAARDLRARDSATPLVLVSVLPPSAETLELAPVAHLVKPVALDELREALARCSPPPS